MSTIATPPAETSATFADFGVPATCRAVLARRGIDEPFPIQAATLPDGLAGRDVCGRAPTGSGKTLAFGLAMVARLDGRKARAPRPRALVLVPTRELAAQVQRELTVLMAEPAARSRAAIYGGVGYGPQRSCSPGRRDRGGLPRPPRGPRRQRRRRPRRRRGRRPRRGRPHGRHGLPARGAPPPRPRPDDRQTLLFSATLDGDVDKLVRPYQHDPVHHAVAAAEADDVEVTHHFWTRVERAAQSAPPPTSSPGRPGHRVQPHPARRRPRGPPARPGRREAAPIHGRRSQAQRDQALEAVQHGARPGPRRHRRGRPRHPRRRRGVRACTSTCPTTPRTTSTARVARPRRRPRARSCRSSCRGPQEGRARSSGRCPFPERRAIPSRAPDVPAPRQRPGPRPGPRPGQRPGARSAHGPKGRGARRPR